MGKRYVAAVVAAPAVKEEISVVAFTMTAVSVPVSEVPMTVDMPKPSWVPNPVGIGLSAVKTWLYHPMAGHFPMVVRI
jgi:hypothetical protein